MVTKPDRSIDFVSVPKGLPSALAKNRQMLKAAAIFYQLKSLYVGGVIKNHPKQLQVIADTFGYSISKLRMYIDILVKKKLAVREGANDLRLRSVWQFAHQEGVSAKLRKWKVQKSELGSMEEILQSLALLENLKQQEHIFKGKVLDCELSATIGTSNLVNLQPSRRKKLESTLKPSFDKIVDKQQTRYLDTVARLKSPSKDLFPFITLSRQGVANLFGRKSKSSGHRLVKKLAKSGLLYDTKNEVSIGSYTYEEYCMLQQTIIDYDYSYQFRSGEVVKVLPNSLRVRDNNILSS